MQMYSCPFYVSLVGNYVCIVLLLVVYCIIQFCTVFITYVMCLHHLIQ